MASSSNSNEDNNNRRKKMKVDGNNVLPNKDEQLMLRNTDALLKSNFLRLQVSELIASVQESPTSSRRKKIETWVAVVTESLVACKKHIGTKLSNDSVQLMGLTGFLLDTAFEVSSRGIHTSSSIGSTSNNSRNGIVNGIQNGSNSSTTTLSFQFQPPAAVHTIGSFVLGTATSPMLNCDLAIVMPDSCFQPSDVLQFRYFDKRKLYLAAVADCLRAEGLCERIQLTHFAGDARKPILVLTPNFKTKYRVRVFAALTPTAFKLSSLRPSKSNFRPTSWLQKLRLAKAAGSSSSASEMELDPSTLPPTPRYNMALLEDATLVPQFRILKRAAIAAPCFRDVCVLLKVWLAKKGLRYGINDVGGHCMQLVVAYLVQMRRIGPQTAVLGAFQAVLAFLADPRAPLASGELSFVSEMPSSSNTTSHTSSGPRWAACLQHPVAKDAVAVQFNALWRVSESGLRSLREEAATALGLLQLLGCGAETGGGADDVDTFQRIFLEGSTSLSRHDLILVMPLCSRNDLASLWTVSEDGAGGQLMPRATDDAEEVACADRTVPQYLCERALMVAKRALSDRVQLLSATLQASGQPREALTDTLPGAGSLWDLDSPPPSDEQVWSVRIGMVLDGDKAPRRVDKSTDEGVLLQIADGSPRISRMDFREFWGDKCELRRFRDGAIVDAVVWTDAEVRAILESRRQRIDVSTGNRSSSSSSSAGSRTALALSGEELVEAVARRALALHLTACAGEQGERLLSMGPGDALLASSGTAHGPTASAQGPSARASFLAAVEAHDRLRALLTAELNGLPLIFEAVAGLSSGLRYSASVVPAPHPFLLALEGQGTQRDRARELLKELSGSTVSLLARPLLVCGQIEGGGKWPTDPAAARRLKTALLMRTGQLLKEQFQIRSQASADHLDIFFRGFVFRLVLVYSAEAAVRPSVRNILSLSRHHQAVRAVGATHPAFSGAVRLASRWLADSWLSGFLSQRQLELLVVRSFVAEAGTSTRAPSTALAALHRCLARLGAHDFVHAGPLMVVLDGEEPPASGEASGVKEVLSRLRSESSSHSNSNSSSSKGSVPFICSTAELLLDGQPAPTIERGALSILQRAAADSAESLASAAVAGNDEDLRAGLDGAFGEAARRVQSLFNVVLKFNPRLRSGTGSSSGGVPTGPRFCSQKVYANSPTSLLDPARMLVAEASETSLYPHQEQMVRELREKFSGHALFFWNEREGDAVGVVFKPTAFVPDSFLPLQCACKTNVASLGEARPSLLSMTLVVSQIVAHCRGLINDIEFR